MDMIVSRGEDPLLQSMYSSFASFCESPDLFRTAGFSGADSWFEL